MNEKINQTLKDYNTNLERKQRLLQPYIDEKNSSLDGFANIKHELEYTRLYYECEMLKRHIEDLKWILE